MAKNVLGFRRIFAALILLMLALGISLGFGEEIRVAKDMPLAVILALAILLPVADIFLLLTFSILVLNYQPAGSMPLVFLIFSVLFIWLIARIFRIKPRVLAPLAAGLSIASFYGLLGTDIFLTMPLLAIGSAFLGAVSAWLVVEVWNILDLPIQRSSIGNF